MISYGSPLFLHVDNFRVKLEWWSAIKYYKFIALIQTTPRYFDIYHSYQIPKSKAWAFNAIRIATCFLHAFKCLQLKLKFSGYLGRTRREGFECLGVVHREESDCLRGAQREECTFQLIFYPLQFYQKNSLSLYISGLYGWLIKLQQPKDEVPA